MLNDYYKCETNMGNDNIATISYCPKAKKSKPSKYIDNTITTTNWAYLPSVVTCEIFNLLNDEDRRNASIVCKNWRQNIFHPRFWQTLSFSIELQNIEKAKFFINNFGKIVANIKIKLNTLIPECTEEFIILLELLRENNNLKELIIEATHCRFEMPQLINGNNNYTIKNVIELLKLCLPYLNKFSIGCIEELSHNIGEYLEILSSKQPLRVTHLGLASVKDVPDEYEMSCFDSSLITPFTNIKILSIDFDELSDKFLKHLDDAQKLERLIVHLHGIRESHPSTTNASWIDFRTKHPHCKLRLTAIHAYNEIDQLHEIVLRREMPLSHLKIFFCENVNITVLEYLLAYYYETLESVIWVDSLNNTDESWTFVKPSTNRSPDPLVLMSWLCKRLKEIILYGYKYREENLIAIARLRGENLKKLEVAEEDVLFTRIEYTPTENSLIDIPLHIKKPWAPIKTADLHPVIRNPIAGDSDEYLLPLVLADLN